jgi:hypothetical protein
MLLHCAPPSRHFIPLRSKYSLQHPVLNIFSVPNFRPIQNHGQDYRWIDNIKMGLLEIGLSVVDWIGLAQDRYRWRGLVNSVMNLRVP